MGEQACTPGDEWGGGWTTTTGSSRPASARAVRTRAERLCWRSAAWRVSWAATRGDTQKVSILRCGMAPAAASRANGDGSRGAATADLLHTPQHRLPHHRPRLIVYRTGSNGPQHGWRRGVVRGLFPFQCPVERRPRDAQGLADLVDRVRLVGVDLTNQSAGTVTVQPNVLSLWGRFTTDPNLIYIGITPTAPSGTYTLTVTLPGGQTVSTTFMVSASAGTTGNIQLALVQSYPAGTVPPGAAGSPSTSLVYYVFRISGVDLTNQSAGTVTVLPNVSFGWGRFTTDSNLIYVGIIATAPSGTYTVTVTLPSGQTASATFSH